MRFCPSCGARTITGARFCGTCGNEHGPREQELSIPNAAVVVGKADDPVPPPTPQPPLPGRPVQPTPDLRAQFEGLERQLPGPLAGVPLELLAVCGLMALAGLVTLWPVTKGLLAALRVLGDLGSFGLFLLDLLLVLGLFGVACLVLAWRLAHADRVARGLSYVLLGGLGVSLLIADEHPTSLVVVMLVCFVALGVLVASPAVQDFFSGPVAVGEPSSVLTARVLVTTWSCCVIAVGLLLLPLHVVGDKYVIAGLGMLAVGVVALMLNHRLVDGDAMARALISAGAGVYAVLLIVAGFRQAGSVLPMSLAIGVVAFLWLPQDARAHFAAGTQPGAMTPPAGAPNRRQGLAGIPDPYSFADPAGAPVPTPDGPVEAAAPPWWGLLTAYAQGAVDAQDLLDVLGRYVVGGQGMPAAVRTRLPDLYSEEESQLVAEQAGQVDRALRDYYAGGVDAQSLGAQLVDILGLSRPA